MNTEADSDLGEKEAQPANTTNGQMAQFLATIIAVARLSGKVVNAPSNEGAALGKEVARLTDVEMAKRRQNSPNHVERCATCAFRLGTVPNGCVPTLMDAMKCVIEGRDEFMCHERENHQCVGYAVLKRDNDKGPECPWPFSNESVISPEQVVEQTGLL